MLHQLPLPPPWGATTLLELVEPTRQTDKGCYYQKCLYLVDRNAKGGKVLLKRYAEFFIPVSRQAVEPLQ